MGKCKGDHTSWKTVEIIIKKEIWGKCKGNHTSWKIGNCYEKGGMGKCKL